ncbi:MAG TPA: hypothetical protein VGH27_30475 [Streptosporangiaceae bacterium]|jgi:hypothetical protein
MSDAEQQAAKVSVDYSQYWVAAGPDISPGQDVISGLLLSLGPQAVAIVTGVQWGEVTVAARAIPEPPNQVDPSWDVIAETDLECPEGAISVCDWAGPAHDELGELAINGPGRYRLRVHIRNREQVSQDRSTEEHQLLVWPASQPTPPVLLTSMDAYGRIFNAEAVPESPGLDILDRAAASAVKQLATLVSQPGPPELTGGLTEIHASAIVPATPKKVWDQVAAPWLWLGNEGGSDPAHFRFCLNQKPRLEAAGAIISQEPPTGVTFSWSWTTRYRVETAADLPHTASRDLGTNQVIAQSRPMKRLQTIPSWSLPPKPTTVAIELRRHGKGTTAVTLQHSGLPVELASTTRPFWQWALRYLQDRIDKAPFYGYPWEQ